MVEVYIAKEDAHNYYADLTGRWYISPSGFLWLEITWEEGSFWASKTIYHDFIREDELREICGDFCA